jgi:multicomponent Na+:H+ antiporter subunit A
VDRGAPPTRRSALLALLVLHGISGLGAIVAQKRLGRRAFLVALAGPLAALAWAASHAADVLDGGVVTEHAGWVPSLGLALDLRFDGFSLLMVVLVSGVGALVFAYGLGYFGPRSPGVGRLAGLLALFAGAMFGLVTADNLLLVYVFWELTSITSYLLIGNDDRDAEARGAALHALLVTGAGGLAMLGGFILLGEAAGTYRLSLLLADPPSGGVVDVALVLVLLGAFTKSAQYPFHSWLPGAMVAPTPVSAYLHSAAMVKAGVYLVARFAPAFAGAGAWRPLVVGVGLVTMLAGGLRALRRYDLKQLLAFGTVSQLGFLMVLLGIGQPEATVAGCALLLAHGLFKAALFMVVGIVDHQAGTRDIRALPALGRGWTPTKVVAVVSAASMAGVPPLAGFIAKESAYEALAHGSSGDRLVLAGIVAGSVLTVAYSLRFAWALLHPGPVVPATASGRAGHEVTVATPPHAHAEAVAGAEDAASEGDDTDDIGFRTGAEVGAVAGTRRGLPPDRPAHAPTPVVPATGTAAAAAAATEPVAAPDPGFLAPAAVLAVATVVFGVAPGTYSALVDAGANALDAAAHAHLTLWHGVTAPLLLTLLTFALGGLVFVGRRPVAKAQAALAPPVSALGVYEATVRGLTRLADQVTRVAQPGSLPLYLSVIVLTAMVVPGLGLILGDDWWPGWPELIGARADIPAAALLVGGAVAAALATRRFTAALLLGSVGYGMALVFVILGAPDLALTQFTIETLSVVLFLLALRRLPDGFGRRTPSRARWGKVAVGATVGAFVFVLALAVGGARTRAPVSGDMIEDAYPEGGGHNVVNVILADIRALDTLGEVAVLSIAAVGATAITRVGRRPPSARPEDEERDAA